MICKDCLFGYHETLGQKDCQCPCHGLAAKTTHKLEAIGNEIKIIRPRLSISVAA
jgi:hypothetical protein